MFIVCFLRLHAYLCYFSLLILHALTYVAHICGCFCYLYTSQPPYQLLFCFIASVLPILALFIPSYWDLVWPSLSVYVFRRVSARQSFRDLMSLNSQRSYQTLRRRPRQTRPNISPTTIITITICPPFRLIHIPLFLHLTLEYTLRPLLRPQCCSILLTLVVVTANVRGLTRLQVYWAWEWAGAFQAVVWAVPAPIHPEVFFPLHRTLSLKR
ncbi:hypothetical protein DFS33DRAFT_892253 [Desarmillaria ectypa]|nr:hypothetical protein DFS33DRAFT_892253 [Desarmillaria ectypa]